MLSRSQRVNKTLFKEVFSNGETHQLGGLYMKVLSKTGEQTRMAFVVPKSIEKQAFRRNKIRRIGTSTLYNLKNLIKDGLVILVFIDTKDQINIQSEIKDLFLKAGFLKNTSMIENNNEEG